MAREAVEAHLHRELGTPTGRGSVSFLGAEPIDVLRFGPDHEGLVRYVTVGMSSTPMTDPTAEVVATDGPRAELVLSVRGVHDGVLRHLAALAASPVVEGIVVGPGASLDVGAPLWEDSHFSSVLVAEPGGLVPDLALGAAQAPVQFLPLLPMTPNEAAWKRVHGAAALEQRWLTAGTDLRAPDRAGVALD